MKLVIEIPKEFVRDFEKDGFKESLERLREDANLLAGNYEKETADMLVEAFRHAELLEEFQKRQAEEQAEKRRPLPCEGKFEDEMDAGSELPSKYDSDLYGCDNRFMEGDPYWEAMGYPFDR